MSGSATQTKKILLLDLDGVTVVGQNSSESKREDIRMLHPELPKLLAAQDLHIVLFTHRASADAEHIRQALINFGVPILYCVSAREMLISALTQFRVIELLKGGLSKKFGVFCIVRKFGISPSQLTLIDDRLEILNEVVNEGVGLALHAPFINNEVDIVSFDFAEVFDIVNANSHSVPASIALQPLKKSIQDLPLLTSIAGSHATKLSLLGRRTIRTVRRLLRKPRG